MDPDSVSERIGLRPAVARANALVWGAAALLCFAAAFALTWVVVRRQEPTPPETAEILMPYFRRSDVASRTFPPPPVSDLDPSRVSALSNEVSATFRGPDADIVTLRVPNGLDVKFLLNNVVPDGGRFPCGIEETGVAAPFDPEFARLTLRQERVRGNAWIVSATPRAPRDILVRGGPGWIADRAVAEHPLYLHCRVRLPLVWENFATRETTVFAYAPRGDAYAALADFVPASFIVVYFFVDDADGVSYVRGQSWLGSAADSPESGRTVYQGLWTQVRWRDIGREGRRDALFVIIGALVALGAAMLVEAARPYIERYVEARGRARSAEERARP